jgi:hypothetical protein
LRNSFYALPFSQTVGRWSLLLGFSIIVLMDKTNSGPLPGWTGRD